MNLAEIRARLAEIAAQTRSMAEQDLDADGQAKFDALIKERDELTAKRDRLEEAARSAVESTRAQQGFGQAPWRQSIDRRDDSINARDFTPTTTRGGVQFRTADGQELRSLCRGEPLTPRGASLPPIGEFLRGMITGRHDGLDAAECRAAVANVNAQGGFLLTPAMSSSFIDLARAASVVERAGATVLPLETSETILAKLDSDATAHWVGELEAITASEPGFNRITLRPRTVGCIVPISIELAEDSQNAGALIEQALQRALAAEMDRVVLDGDGSSGEPLGIISTPNVNEESTVGTPTSYDEVADAVGAILGANYDADLDNLAWILHPSNAATYAKLVTSTEGQPLQPGPWVAPLRKFHTTNIPAGTSLVGDFSQVVLGMRTSGVRIEVFDAGTATSAAGVTTNAVTQLAKLIRAYVRMDCCIMRPTWMTKLTGITTGE